MLAARMKLHFKCQDRNQVGQLVCHGPITDPSLSNQILPVQLSFLLLKLIAPV